jgi:hypothetical protein
MKFVIVLIFSLALSVAHSKNIPHKVFGLYSSLITKATSVNVFQIEKYPVVSADQLPNVMYKYDYEINKVYEHSSKMANSFVTYLLDSTQYAYDDKRTCPFIGKYAVEFTKGKNTLTIIFSEAPCYKMIIFCPGTDIDKKHIDLGKNNKIYNTLIPLATDRM